jgi:SAM-dependent methyltransferase
LADLERRPGADTEVQRLSAIAHTGSPMWGPIGVETIADIAGLLERHGIDESSRVLDLGCGPAELLRRICESTGASGTGVDASPFALTEARRRLASSPARGRIDLRLGDATKLDPRGDKDLVVCIGPGWKSGGWRALTTWASDFAVRGGLLLLGEGAWRREPAPEALARLELRANDYLASSGVPAAVEAAGASVTWTRIATPGEWSAYADHNRAAMRAFARDHPHDPGTPALLGRAEAGWGDYETLHDLLDFVLVLATS